MLEGIGLILVLLVGLFLLGLTLYRRANYGKLEGLGFPIIKPTLFLGSVPDTDLRVQHLEDLKRFRKYGRIWGLYEGRSASVYICDPDLVRCVFVQDTESFAYRTEPDFGDPILKQVLDNLKGEKAKLVRSLIMTPLFSARRLGVMCQFMVGSVTEFVSRLNEACLANGGRLSGVDFKERFDVLTIDILTRCAFSIKTDSNENSFVNEFIRCFKKLRKRIQEPKRSRIHTLNSLFPFFKRLVPAPALLDQAMTNTILKMLSRPRAKTEGDLADALRDMLGRVGSAEFQALEVTESTVLGQAVCFFMTSFNPISTTLAMMAY